MKTINYFLIAFCLCAVLVLGVANVQAKNVGVNADLSQCDKPQCTWDFGGENSTAGCNSVSHAFSEADDHQVTLTVDCGKFSQEVTRTVSVESSGPFYKEDGIIHCENAEIGQKGMVDGTEYIAVSESTLREWANNWRDHDLSTACTSYVTDMSELFEDAYDFNQDISSWDTSNVRDMGHMFAYTEKFNQDIGAWDVANVQDMEYMFYRADGFNQDLSNWDVYNAHVEYFAYDAKYFEHNDEYHPNFIFN